MNKNVILVMGLTVMMGACSSPAEPVEENAGAQVEENASDEVSEFGEVKVMEDKAVSVAEMMTAFEANGSQEAEFTVKGEITQVCAKMGCWVRIKNGDTPFMVRFKDHFTIPTETAEGTMAALHGRAYVDTVSVDMLRHYEEDAGASEEEIMKITEPEINFGFEADGIKLL